MLKIKWLGHGSFKIKTKDKLIYIDPDAGPDEAYTEKADLILLSQGQYDHYEGRKIKMISVDSTKIVTNHAIAAATFEAIAMRPGDSVQVDGIGIKAVRCEDVEIPRAPLKPKIPDHVIEEHLGFRLRMERKTVYYAADTGYYDGIEENKCDVALIPVGGSFTMDANTAAKVTAAIKPKVAIPMNYGQRVGTEPVDHPDYAYYFKDALYSLDPEIRVEILKPGEFITF